MSKAAVHETYSPIVLLTLFNQGACHRPLNAGTPWWSRLSVPSTADRHRSRLQLITYSVDLLPSEFVAPSSVDCALFLQNGQSTHRVWAWCSKLVSLHPSCTASSSSFRVWWLQHQIYWHGLQNRLPVHRNKHQSWSQQLAGLICWAHHRTIEVNDPFSSFSLIL